MRRGHNFIGEAVTLSWGELWGWAGCGTGAYKLQVKLFKGCQLKQIHSANLKLFILKHQAIYSILEEKQAMTLFLVFLATIFDLLQSSFNYFVKGM